MAKITPVVGRVVHFFDGPDITEPKAATVAFVQHEPFVNLTVHDHNGETFAVLNVPLVQEGEKLPTKGPRCCWMQYQIDAAAAAAPKSTPKKKAARKA
jgi:hypothetical protein